MRYYVEINGESSLDIQGLMIQSLPSISKPLMRSKQETIDGRDGDIVTKLGYSAYDKTLKIGLWGNYDINEVIAFFNQEGVITFSNEPDKYYRFTILNRDDYVSQLDKFRTCTIALHCQPYKYKLNEEPEEIENEYVEQEGTSLTFTNTLEAPMNIDLKGNTLQTGTPTPSSPIPINNVSGDNDVVVNTKNLFNVNEYKEKPNSITISDNKIIMENAAYTPIVYVIKVNNNTTYNISCNSLNTNIYRLQVKASNSSGTAGTTIVNGSIYALSYSESFITTSEYIRIEIFQSTSTSRQEVSNIQLELGNQATPYKEYNGTTYNIDLPVENLLDDSTIINGVVSNNSIGSSTTRICNDTFIKVQPNTTYTLSFNTTNGINNINISSFTTNAFPRASQTWWVSDFTFTTDSTTNYVLITFRNSNDIDISPNDISNVMLELGSKVNTYTPYGTTPIELNKIGTYQDYIYKDNDKWYLHKEICKVVYNGVESENWALSNATGGKQFIIPHSYIARDYSYTNMFIRDNNATSTGTPNAFYFGAGSLVIVKPSYNGTSITTVENWKTFLNSNNLIVYSILTTPTNTEITYTPLIEQLESIKNAMSKEGTTNVNQVNNDAPFILDLSVLSGTDSITLTNEGNATSKPTLTITGSGVVGVYLENIQMFNISLGTNETIIIDTENMEAYYGSQLKNRQVTGDYSNFALQSGTNNLKFTGVVTNVEITNYNRWI